MGSHNRRSRAPCVSSCHGPAHLLPHPFLLLLILQPSWPPVYRPLRQCQVLPPTFFCTKVPSARLHRLGLGQSWLLLPLCRKSHCGLSTAFPDPSPGRLSGPSCRTFLFFYGTVALSIHVFVSCFVHLPLQTLSSSREELFGLAALALCPQGPVAE